jgi:cytoskeletal protein RodZ
MQAKRFSLKWLTLALAAIVVLLSALALWIVSFPAEQNVAPGIGPGGGISGSMQIR